MKSCVCAQCSDHAPGYAPEYLECEECREFGTIDEFPEGSDVCWDCTEKAQGSAELAVEVAREGV